MFPGFYPSRTTNFFNLTSLFNLQFYLQFYFFTLLCSPRGPTTFVYRGECFKRNVVRSPFFGRGGFKNNTKTNGLFEGHHNFWESTEAGSGGNSSIFLKRGSPPNSRVTLSASVIQIIYNFNEISMKTVT